MRWTAARSSADRAADQLAAQALHLRLDLREPFRGYEVAVRADLQLGERLALRTVAFLHECPAHGAMLPARAPA